MHIVAGRQDVKGEDIIPFLSFRGYSGTALSQAVKAAIRSFSLVEARRFLLFATASSALPSAGKKITFSKKGGSTDASLPVAHTCFNRVDMADLRDRSEVARRLRLAVACLEDSGFGIA